NHHRIAQLDDFRKPGDGGGLLELHQHRGAAGDELASLGHVFGALHEGHRDPIDAYIEREGEIRAILRRQGRERQHGVWHVDAFAVREIAAGDDPRLGEILAAFLYLQADIAVIEQEVGARLERREDLRVRQGGALGVPRRGTEIEAETLARDELDLLLGESADAQLRALQIGHDADRPADAPFERADRVANNAVIFL